MVRISRSISPHAAKANAKADTRGRSSLVPARRVHGPRCSRVKGAAARRHEERDSVRTSAARCAIIVMGITRGWTGGEVALFAGQPPCETCSAPKRAKHARRTNRQARSLRPQIQDASHSQFHPHSNLKKGKGHASVRVRLQSFEPQAARHTQRATSSLAGGLTGSRATHSRSAAFVIYVWGSRCLPAGQHLPPPTPEPRTRNEMRP